MTSKPPSVFLFAFVLAGALLAGQGEPQVTASQAEPQVTASQAEPAAEPSMQAEPAPAPPPTAAAPVGQPAATAATGVAAAANESVETLAGGGKALLDQGRGMWQNILIPMWQRLAAALPGLVKALAVLLIFWLVAIVAGAAVRKGLGLTKLDNRAARDWGLGNLLTAGDGSKRSIESLGGSLVKWLILLFGFVAFFQAIDLGMVAGPLQGIVEKVVGVVPNLLQAALILFIFWIVAALLRTGVSRGLAAIGFDDKAKRFIPEREVKGQLVRPSGMVGRLVFYLVLLFGLPPFLDALGQQALVAPLGQMLERALAFVPNIVGAALIFVIGHLVATVLREIVSSFLTATGVDAGVRKLGLGSAAEKLKISEIAGTVVYFFVIVPVLGAAVESLGIRAISDPVTRTLESLLAAVPLVFVAAIVVGVGYFLARIVGRILQSFLSGVGFDLLPEKLGLGFLKRDDERAAPSRVVSTAVMLVIVLLTVEQALATLRLGQLAELIGRFIGYLPQVLVGLVVILAALSLSAYASRLVESAFGDQGHGRVLSRVTRYAILFFGFGIGLNELGVGESLVTVAVSAAFGGTALALGLAFGLGGRDRAKRLIDDVETS